ncbi:Uncharacterised protein [Legionella pneumophila]|nr:Uncharacterised protein [Legionella pneumophila]CZM94108.1 Uncharacterised protein [Legionella pneumophila]
MKKDDAKTEIYRIWLNWNEPQDKYLPRFGWSFIIG